MHRVGCADKPVVGRVHQIPDFLDLPRDIINIRLRRDARRLGLLLDFLSVLVCTGLEIYVISGHTLKARNRVRQYDFIGVADVRFGRCVCNCSRYIIGFPFHSEFLRVLILV